jgi:hypothetical protein
MMKVDKKKFIESMEYLREINSQNLKDLDMSEFTDRDLTKEIKEWDFTGLANRDFIQMMLVESGKWETISPK